MAKFTFIAIVCLCCCAFSLRDAKSALLKDGKIWVNNSIYCLYEEPKKGSRSFNIITPDGEVVIVAVVKVVEKEGKVHNYFTIKFIPTAKELNIRYSKNFPSAFIQSLVDNDVIQDGVWNEYGAIQLFNRWSLDNDAIINPETSEFVYNAELSGKLADHNIIINTQKQIFINDSLVYKYTAWNNFMRSSQYRKGNDGTYYRIYDLDSNLQTEIAVYDHRSEMKNNVQMIIMPEQKLYYFNHINCKDEKAVLNTAIKMLIIKKWRKS